MKLSNSKISPKHRTRQEIYTGNESPETNNLCKIKRGLRRMRSILGKGTLIRLSQGEIYKITGNPIGEGGGSIVYPCKKMNYINGIFTSSEIDYALKECFPLSSYFVFERSENGEIVADANEPMAVHYLDSVKKMQMQEQKVTGKIYNTAIRMLPVINASEKVAISFDEGRSFHLVNNTVTIMTSFELKGKALKYYISQGKIFSVIQAFQVIKQLLFAVKEVHEAGFLHLDIQDGNVFIKGSLSEEDNFVSLLDFGSSRPLLKDGLCDVISDGVVFSTGGFSAPEIVEKNDGTLRLGVEADIYSIGYLLLLMLTGKRYSQRELSSANIGLFLSKRKLKKLNCPLHMTDKIHQIISRTLKKAPEDRYHSCEEMLIDVSDFLHALQPYQTDLSQVVYDAFICYRHGEIDSKVAQILQKKMEHFHTPISYKNKSGKIKRIFMDEGELSSCSDFGLQIREALKNSGWLIVICSPKTKDSPWVNLEIKTFLEFHDRSRILAVVTEGEPKEVLPEELLGGSVTSEVLAADARGKTRKQILQNTKKNVLLKIVAPILGTTYDSLKQRRKNYIIKKYAVIMTAFLIVADAMFLFILNRNRKIEEQYLQIKKNEAENQVILSESLLKEGNREGALQAALAVQWDQDNDIPVIPEQMYALNSALYSYYHAGNIEGFRPSKQIELENNTADVCEFSPDGDIFFCLDEVGIAYFYDTKDWILQWKCKLGGVTDRKNVEKNIFIDGKFVSDKKIVLFSTDTAYYIDIELEKCIKKINLDGCACESESGKPIYALNNENLVVGYDNWESSFINVYSLTQDVIKTVYLITEEDEYFKDIVFSPNGSTLAINRKVYSFESHDSGGRIYIVDLNTGEQTTLTTDSVSLVYFVTDAQFATVQYKSVPFGDGFIENKERYYETIYEIGKGEVWKNITQCLRAPYSVRPFPINIMVYDEFEFDAEEKADVIIFSIGTHLMVVDKSTYKILCEEEFAYPIENVSVYNESTLLLGLSDGSVERFWFDYYQKIFEIDNCLITNFLYNTYTETIVQVRDENSSVIISQIAQDESMTSTKVQDFKMKHNKKETCVKGESTERFAMVNEDKIDIYNGLEEEAFLSIPCQNSENALLTFFKGDERLILYCNDNIEIWDLASGANITTKRVNIDSAGKTDILTDSEGKYFALYTREVNVSISLLYGWLERELNIYYVDQNSQIHPYADIPYAYVDFEKKIIYSLGREDKIYYSAPFYEYKELKEVAYQFLNNNRKSSSKSVTVISK